MMGEYTPVFTRNITYKAFFLSLLMFSLIFFYGIECYIRMLNGQSKTKYSTAQR